MRRAFYVYLLTLLLLLFPIIEVNFLMVQEMAYTAFYLSLSLLAGAFLGWLLCSISNTMGDLFEQRRIRKQRTTLKK